MSRTTIKTSVLRALGFQRIELDGGKYHYYSLSLGGGLAVWFTDGVVELSRDGVATPMPTLRSEEQLKQLITNFNQ